MSRVIRIDDQVYQFLEQKRIALETKSETLARLLGVEVSRPRTRYHGLGPVPRKLRQLKEKCPKCGAVKQDRCWSLVSKVPKRINYIHPERYVERDGGH